MTANPANDPAGTDPRRNWARSKRHRDFRHEHGHRMGGVTFALGLMALGCLFLLNNFEILDFGWRQAWPLFILVPGILNLLTARDGGQAVGGVVMTAVGGFFFLRMLGFQARPVFEWVWPVLLIGGGVSMLIRHARQQNRGHNGYNGSSADLNPDLSDQDR